ncbi:MAG: LCP family protein [Breznakia sp.]
MKKNIDNKINYILIVVLSIFLVVFLYFLMNIVATPLRWRLGICAIFVLLSLISILLLLKQMYGYKNVLARIACVLLVFTLGIGSFYSFKIADLVDRIVSEDDEEKYEKVFVVSSSSNKDLQDIAQLEDKVVGVQTKSEVKSTAFAKAKLDKIVSNVSYVVADDYYTLMESLEKGEIDALIIREHYINLFEQEEEGFSAKLKTLTSFDMLIEKGDNSATKASSKKDLSKEPFTIYLSGVDTTDGSLDSLRSDVNIILIVNPITRHLEMISLPRDSFVPNIALGYENDKLTHLGNDGMNNIMDSIENVIDFKLDYYLQVNFTSVEEIVDAIGGIDVYVPITYTEQNSNREAGTVELVEGQQHLDGEHALALARHRKLYGDIERGKTQLSIIQAMVEKLLTVEGAKSAPELLNIIPKHVKTSMTSSQINGFLNSQLDNLKPWTFTNFALGNGATGMMTTASMGSMPLSCYMLSYTDIEELYEHYQMIINPVKFSEFSFNLSNLGGDLPAYTRGEGVLFVGDDFSSYAGVNTTEKEEVVEVEKEPVRETEKPVDPDAEKPIDPDAEKPVDPDAEKPVDPDAEKPVDPDAEKQKKPNVIPNQHEMFFYSKKDIELYL